jgi:small subunit ribosomal protein S4
VITLKEHARHQLRVQNALALAQARPACGWLEVDMAELKGVFKQMPDRGDLSAGINESLIVEFYSK